MTTWERILRTSPVVAVLGAHHERSRAAFYVPAYLHAQGYRVIPVNPALVGRELWGEPVRATLAEIGEPVDLVDVFRRSDFLAGHLPDLLAMDPRPRAVWLQLGIRDDEFGEQVVAAGMEFEQDRCALADHQRLGLGQPAR